MRWGAWISALLEECAALLWATNERRRGQLAVFGLIVLLLLFEVIPQVGWRGVGGFGVMFALVAVAASDVTRARRLLWLAATRRIGAGTTGLGIDNGGVHAPTARALRSLAIAVDAARRGQARQAQEQVGQVDRQRLRPDELRLLDAVRAIVSIHLGERERAARQAVLALPTGSPDLDLTLGRAVFASAWQSRPRLAAIDAAWNRAGVRIGGDQALPRLRRLLQVRLRAEEVDALSAEDARCLAAEAEAIGDAELAAELDAAARRSRGYR